MRHHLPRRSCLRRLALNRIVGVSLMFPVAMTEFAGHAAQAAEHQKQVLVLYSTRRDSQIAAVGERELPLILEAGVGGELDYYSEFIDRGRFPDPQYKQAFREFLRVKYRGLRFDTIIAMQDLALEFLGESRNELFPGSPVVFFATSDATRRIPNSTGVLTPLDFSGTLSMALVLQPEVRKVFVVSGADPGALEYEMVARSQFKSFESRVAVTYLTGLPTKELDRRLGSLPDRSIIYYLVANRDGAGTAVHPLEYLDHLAAVATTPIYCWVDSAMDHGIVGGSLKNQIGETDAVARVALRVLKGERADSIPISVTDLSVSQVDWRQVRRWGINESLLPLGTEIKFRDPSVWRRYGGYIAGAAVVLLFQSVLIAGLLVERSRRRVAEGQVRASRESLGTSDEHIRDLVGRLLNAQETERSHIARELHDDISQQVALLAIELELVGRRHDADRQITNDALSRAHSIAKSLHDLSHRLHPARLRLIGLVAAVNGLRQELSTPDVAITFAHRDVPTSLTSEQTLCLFRVVQEALRNAIKYSSARHISVRLAGGPAGLELTVVDDGVGFDVDKAWGRGLGLISMNERLEAIDGTIEIHSSPGAGTRLEVAAPLYAARGGGPV